MPGGVVRQHRRKSQPLLAAVKQTLVGEQGVDDALLHGLVEGFAVEVAKAEAELPLNLRQHLQEAVLPIVG
jgi:hypothetical protein